MGVVMKIKMLATKPGSEDGFTIRDYVEGREYEVGDALAKTFIDAGEAEKVKQAKSKDK